MVIFYCEAYPSRNKDNWLLHVITPKPYFEAYFKMDYNMYKPSDFGVKKYERPLVYRFEMSPFSLLKRFIHPQHIDIMTKLYEHYVKAKTIEIISKNTKRGNK